MTASTNAEHSRYCRESSDPPTWDHEASKALPRVVISRCNRCGVVKLHRNTSPTTEAVA